MLNELCSYSFLFYDTEKLISWTIYLQYCCTNLRHKIARPCFSALTCLSTEMVSACASISNGLLWHSSISAMQSRSVYPVTHSQVIPRPGISWQIPFPEQDVAVHSASSAVSQKHHIKQGQLSRWYCQMVTCIRDIMASLVGLKMRGFGHEYCIWTLSICTCMHNNTSVYCKLSEVLISVIIAVCRVVK